MLNGSYSFIKPLSGQCDVSSELYTNSKIKRKDEKFFSFLLLFRLDICNVISAWNFISKSNIFTMDFLKIWNFIYIYIFFSNF